MEIGTFQRPLLLTGRQLDISASLTLNFNILHLMSILERLKNSINRRLNVRLIVNDNQIVTNTLIEGMLTYFSD